MYSGLATDNFLTRRQEDISLSEYLGISSKFEIMKLLSTSVEEKIEEARQTIGNIKDRLGQAWKVSEKKALKRKMKRKQEEIEDNKLILQKRRDFLDLVKQGLNTWKGQDSEDQKTSATSTSSWGRDLGLSMTFILPYYCLTFIISRGTTGS